MGGNLGPRFFKVNFSDLDFELPWDFFSSSVTSSLPVFKMILIVKLITCFKMGTSHHEAWQVQGMAQVHQDLPMEILQLHHRLLQESTLLPKG